MSRYVVNDDCHPRIPVYGDGNRLKCYAFDLCEGELSLCLGESRLNMAMLEFTPAEWEEFKARGDKMVAKLEVPSGSPD